MPDPDPEIVHLPCPECLGHEQARGACRIGHHRNRCGTCNRFNQRVRSRIVTLFRERNLKLFQSYRRQAELDIYPSFIDAYQKQIDALMAEREERARRISRALGED